MGRGGRGGVRSEEGDGWEMERAEQRGEKKGREKRRCGGVV